MKIKLSELDLPERDLRASVDEESLDELADSMRDHGQLQPIGVFQKPNGRYEVEFGARRTRAAILLGWEEIDAAEVRLSENGHSSARKLIENVQRENLTAMEEAYGLIELVGDGEIDVRALRRSTGKSLSWIKSRLELLEMPDDAQAVVQKGLVSPSVAKILSQIENHEVRETYFNFAIENGCTIDTAKYWLSQAKFAENGELSMQEFEAKKFDKPEITDVVERHWSCFTCGLQHTAKNCSTIVMCGTCIAEIVAHRNTSAAS